jgi:cation:H+ antiporter
MSVILGVVIFVVSLAVLIKASDFFTGAAEKIGIKLGIPAFIIGVTIVAVGTSLPELISSIFAVTGGVSEIVIGNVLGSNIANILLILGVVAFVSRKIETDYEILKVDLPIFFASAMFVVFVSFDGIINMWEGIIGLLGAVVYFSFAGMSSRNSGSKKVKKIRCEKKELRRDSLLFQLLIVFVSGIFIFFGAKYLIDSVIRLSDIFNIGKEIIAISAVALGTSLPELFVGVQAARKGNAGMAFGNVLGSNIFNSFIVLGIPALIGPLIVPQGIIMFSLPVMVGASFLYFFMIQDKQLTIWEGLILLLFYVMYIGKVFEFF